VRFCTHSIRNIYGIGVVDLAFSIGESSLYDNNDGACMLVVEGSCGFDNSRGFAKRMYELDC